MIFITLCIAAIYILVGLVFTKIYSIGQDEVDDDVIMACMILWPLVVVGVLLYFIPKLIRKVLRI
jgi:hypothetical protein